MEESREIYECHHVTGQNKTPSGDARSSIKHYIPLNMVALLLIALLAEAVILEQYYHTQIQKLLLSIEISQHNNMQIV